MDPKALRALKASLSKAAESARNQVNIIFPKEFGSPQLLKVTGGWAAFFPENVLIQTAVRGQPNRLRPMAKGATPAEALANLFQEYADTYHYDGVVVTDPEHRRDRLFQASEYPYGTRAFSQVKKLNS